MKRKIFQSSARPAAAAEFRKDQNQQTLVNQAALEVKFGVASRDCDNYGICLVKLVRAASLFQQSVRRAGSCKGCSAKAIISHASPGHLELAFLKSSLSEKVIQHYFCDSFFNVNEDFYFPDSVCRALQTEELIITKGCYSMQETKGFLLVQF